MAKSYWLINSNRSEVKRFMKNDKSIDGVFEYMFIDTGKIVGGLGKEPPLMTNTVSVEIDLAREIYERLLSQGWRKIEKVWTQIESQIYAPEFTNEINLEFNNELLTKLTADLKYEEISKFFYLVQIKMKHPKWLSE